MSSIDSDKIVKTKECRECGNAFPITKGELDWMKEKFGDLFSEPVRCSGCRKKRKGNSAFAATDVEPTNIVGPNMLFKFNSSQASYFFKMWLATEGERKYKEWMEHREMEEDGDITGVNFDYDNGSVIDVDCGRLFDDK